MTIGYPLILCALAAIATGAAEPLLRRLGLKRFPAAMVLVTLLLLGAVEGFAAVWFLLLPAFFCLWSLHWTAGRICAILGMAALGGLLFCGTGLFAMFPEPGVLMGAACAVLCVPLCYRRVSLAAALGAVPVALTVSLALEGLFGVVFSLPNTAYFDAAVTATIASSLLNGAIEGIRSWRRARV